MLLMGQYVDIIWWIVECSLFIKCEFVRWKYAV